MRQVDQWMHVAEIRLHDIPPEKGNKNGQAQQFRDVQNHFRQRSLHQKLSTDTR
jgi:hypothetical protein